MFVVRAAFPNRDGAAFRAARFETRDYFEARSPGAAFQADAKPSINLATLLISNHDRLLSIRESAAVQWRPKIRPLSPERVDRLTQQKSKPRATLVGDGTIQGGCCKKPGMISNEAVSDPSHAYRPA